MAIDTLEYPELHDESIPTLAFIKSLNRLLIAAGIKDFNLQVVVMSSWATAHPRRAVCLSLSVLDPAQLRCRIYTSQTQIGLDGT